MGAPPDQSAFLSALMASLGEGVYAVDREGRLTYMNPAAERLLGWTEAELRGRDMHEAVHRTDPQGRPFPREACPLLRVIRTGEPVTADDDGFVRRDGSLLPVGYSSAPIEVDGRIAGAVVAFRDLSERELLQKERARAAAALQRSLLPPALPDDEHVELAARFLPLQTDALVGGDFYDVLRADGGLTLVLGDVCGKGLEAAGDTGLVRQALRAVAPEHPDPAETLVRANAVLDGEFAEGRFCTAVVVRVEPDGAGARVCASSAGHPPPVILRASGATEVLGAGTVPLGAFAVVAARTDEAWLDAGDAVVLYTDGVIDAARGAAPLEVDRVLAGARGLAADAIADRLLDAAVEASGGRRRDDVALLVGRVRAPARAAP